MKRLVALGAALALGGCGLQPLYGGGPSSTAATALRSIRIDPIPGRTGWLLRTALANRIGDHDQATAFRLHVEVDDDITKFGIRGDSSASRERRTIRARYQLLDGATGAVLLDATAGSDAGIDVVSSEYATVAAEETAAENLSQLLADQIVSRVGLYAARRGLPRQP